MSVEDLEQMLQNSKSFYKDDNFPPNSCHLCSKPTCNFKNKTCEKWSKLGPFPIYNNILEYMIYTHHMGVENIAKITLNANCSFKINMKKRTQNGEEGHNLVVETCLKSGTNCFLYYNTTFKKNSKITCTNLVLVLRGEKIFYIDGVTGHVCFDPPSFYLKSISQNEIQREECYRNESLMKPTVTFEFLQTENRSYDGVPLFLPCSPGGSVVDIKTGRFLYGNKCSKMFKKTKYKHFTGKRGIEFVITKFFDKNENIKFPVYKDEGNSTRHRRPIYIKEDGTPHSVKKMAPKKRRNKEKGTKSRELCKFVEVDRSCNTTKMEKIQDSLRKLLPTYRKGKFHPSFCQFCSKPYCDFNDTECELTSFVGPVPLYNNVFEYMFLTSMMAVENIAKIHINENCYIKINFKESRNDERGHTVELHSCVGSTFSGEVCSLHAKRTESEKAVDFRCSTMVVTLKERKKFHVYGGYGEICFDPPRGNSPNLTSLAIELKQEDCFFNESVFKPIGSFFFVQDDKREYDGVPVFLPCISSGRSLQGDRRSARKYGIGKSLKKKKLKKTKTSSEEFLKKKTRRKPNTETRESMSETTKKPTSRTLKSQKKKTKKKPTSRTLEFLKKKTKKPKLSQECRNTNSSNVSGCKTPLQPVIDIFAPQGPGYKHYRIRFTGS
ncbi:UNVERIFIED_CONTAM: hypothetical protein RMT77_016152 [Armadillidium vulgare]